MRLENVVGLFMFMRYGWLGSRVVSVLDSGAEGPGFKSQSRCCRVTVLGRLFAPVHQAAKLVAAYITVCKCAVERNSYHLSVSQFEAWRQLVEM